MTHAYLFIYLMHSGGHFISYLQRLHYKYPFSFIQTYWDIEDTNEMKEKIWKIAQQRYKGWRATFSATYKTFNTYNERMKTGLKT